VSFSASYADREKDSPDKAVLTRLKEGLFECGSADSYNVCEWASIDRLERGKRGGKVAALRAAIAAQAILTFDDKLQTPRDMADVPVAVQELTGSHYTTIRCSKAQSASTTSTSSKADYRKSAGGASRTALTARWR